MRIMIKGGVWKNTEDEILKAAVMKYGLNQWSRISSLLVRKSAKQCKARWYEWLDPAIKKTEWTREEDEKLLHLAKLLPTQWRTIAPIVGRTPAQCLERYEKLLDMAVGKEGAYDPADDPRRLRPGEIDPNPESKPARPDAVDMDEDEKEMLAEARARLANTRGKKAKRKAREKQLEEARRLAQLQKKRELKAAGIELRGKERRNRGIDYSAEVAFERKPAPGFYDTGEEVDRTRNLQQEFRPVTIEEMEGKRRKDIEEALTKRDIKRQKLTDNKDVPGMVARVNEMNSTALGRRTKMMLPAPQVSEAELEAIARMGDSVAELEEAAAAGPGGDATRALMGQYGQTPAKFATPMRTPRTTGAGGQDSIMAQAQNLVRLNQLQTPLLGGDNPELHPSDWSGLTPKPAVAATPNPLAARAAAAGATPLVGATPAGGKAGGFLGATPGRGAIAGVAATPAALAGATPGRGMPGATPMATPLRDELGLNEGGMSLAVSSQRALREQQSALRRELRSGLGSLPSPQHQYELDIPELPPDEEEGDGLPEDAADAKARRQREVEAARAAAEKLKSKVLQRHLPRPVSLELLPPPKQPAEVAAMSLRERAEYELGQELAALLTHDAAAYPIAKEDAGGKEGGSKKGSKKGSSSAAAEAVVMAPAVPLEQFSLDEMQGAALLLEEEVLVVKRAMGHADTPLTEYSEAFHLVTRDMVWLPGQKRFGRAVSATPAERIESVRAEHEAVRSEMVRRAKRAAKIEQKVNILVAGLQQRAGKLQGQLGEAWEAVGNTQVELECFKALQSAEARSAPARLEALRGLLAGQRALEAALQQVYKGLLTERDDLKEAAQHQKQQQQQQTQPS